MHAMGQQHWQRAAAFYGLIKHCWLQCQDLQTKDSAVADRSAVTHIGCALQAATTERLALHRQGALTGQLIPTVIDALVDCEAGNGGSRCGQPG